MDSIANVFSAMTTRHIPILFIVFCLSGCASTRFKSWQGGGVQVGSGGACEQIAGVDVWSFGKPNRPYRVIGIIEDTRPGGIIPMARRASVVAHEAKRNGGDGIIIIDESKEYRGSINTMNTSSVTNYNSSMTGIRTGNLVTLNGYGTATTTGTGTGVSMPVFRASGVYQVIKYENGGSATQRTTRTATSSGGVKTDNRGTSFLE